ncbi:MAG: L-serine ammonia-lyase, iron-sulfur-dependent, subunit alpha [Candidatus Faecousia sp.]|nr:L-serine ammonia-lyase, iron-sulfur-dependent, subunit alpha [Clostridiales bacterium]MDD7651525.1 L-serine ammonia-lyase, iron-sulfur-dependent, subunit alpha [Bacillota bacterium]MDY4220784.1 L-serine ammonia-lyase, iron-sulfur-dependent, subunit alpha [Candidatus Faecousia sp.]
MKSIRDIYKIGKGPSSSHTMGPERAARLFLSEHPEADRIRVILYGSLSKTGVGHGTDRVLQEVLSSVENEIVFSKEQPQDVTHPNTMDFFAYKEGQETGHIRVESIGGGDIVVQGREKGQSEEVYPENSFAEIKDFCKWRYITTLSEYVEMNEGPEIWDFLREVWETMKRSINDGLSTTGILPGGLNVQRRAKHLLEQQLPTEVAQVRECRIICAYAFAVSEQNADNGTIVTAPTCGAAGVLPAVLRYIHETGRATEEQVIRALGTAGIIGNLAKRNASISGAECGCQAEVGVACAMAAAASAELYGLSLDQVEYAAEISLEHHLGLTCDPICGLVQIPCIERNAVAAMRAMNACNLSYFLCGTRNISYDMVCKAMYETGLNLSHQYKETSEGGLARFYNRRRSGTRQ